MSNNQNKITGIFDELKELNKKELSDTEKDKILNQIDCNKNPEGYYLDAFGERISFNGIRQLKKPYTKLELNELQQREIQACHQDYFYFRRNYCKILTKSGIGRPEPREYQKRLEEELVKGDDVLAFFPRQCVSEDTIITINNKDISVGDFYNKHIEKEQHFSQYKDDLFTSVIDIHAKNLKVNSYSNATVEQVLKTKELPLFVVTLKGLKTNKIKTLKCSNKHVIIDTCMNEIYAEDSLDCTVKGYTEDYIVTNVTDTGTKEQMYDLSISSIDELYYTDDVLSHNSGKTVTIAVYLLWKFLTEQNINIGISANVVSLAQEVLDKIKKIYIELPIWLQPGLMSWNKQSIEADNGNKILISASNSDAFRGFSLTIMYCSHEDEIVTVKDKNTGEVKDISLKELAKEMGYK
jgi:hypothetical protein